MHEDTVYDELGVPTVINAVGTKTRIGGTRIREEALEAMVQARDAFVRLSDLQARASELIAEATGAEAGYVTSGAAAALALGSAAAIAGDDIGAMARLPDTEGVADEIVMPRTHRTGYDHALRAAGARIVDVGTNDLYLGSGAANTEPWEIADAIGEETAAVGYVQKPDLGPPLEAVVEVAHEHDVPVIVDAAAELPPPENLERFVAAGADLVAYSGGKAIRGPQTTGILAGRADLIESVALQHLDMHAADRVWDPPEAFLDVDQLPGVPRQGLGRPMKVGKEELVGLLRALELFVEEDQDAVREERLARARRIAEGLDGGGLEATVREEGPVPDVTVDVTEAAGVSAAGIVGGLRSEDPRVFVGADHIADDRITVNPMCLTDAEAEYVIERFRARLG